MEQPVKCSSVLMAAIVAVLMMVSVDCVRHVRENNQRTGLELSVISSGPIIEGSTVTIRCRAPPGVKQPFDVLRLDRLVDGRIHEMTTNNIIRDVFKQSGRYQVADWDDDQGNIDLRIEHIQGIDGGNIGCRLLSESHNKPADAFTDLIVNVPPRAVEIWSQSAGGNLYRAAEAELLRLPVGVLTTLTCRVTITDTDFAPDVIVTSDGRDVTSRFVRNFTMIAREDEDQQSKLGFAQLQGRSYEYQLKVDPTGSDVASVVHGKNLTCMATLPHYKPVMASVKLEVAYKPQVRCDPEHGGLLGETNFEVVCTGRSHPAPRRVVWSWNHEYSGDVIPPGGSSSDMVSMLDANDRIEIFNGHINQQGLRPIYSASQSEMANSEYEFRLRISQLESRDFRSYDLEVSNEIGTTRLSFRISQVLVSTSKRPSTPRTQNTGDLRQPAESLKSASEHLQSRHIMTSLVSLTAAVISVIQHLVRT